MQAYEGYFENGQFYTGGKIIKIPEGKRVILTLPEEPAIIPAGISEEEEDEYLLALVLERKKHDNGVRICFEEHLAKRGLTVADIEAMEDVEIE